MTTGLGDRLILISGSDQFCRGGLHSYDGERVEFVDAFPGAGLWASDGRLVRVFRSDECTGAGTEIVEYGPDGIVCRVAVSGCDDAHDVLWDGTHYVVVSSVENVVLWIRPDGEVVRRYQPVNGHDCWHLNCLYVHQGRLCVTAFGRFAQEREWVRHLDEGTGVLFEIDSGQDIVVGLRAPHTPRLAEEGLYICDSRSGRLLLFDAQRFELSRSVQLRGWVRGLVVTPDYLFVGESAHRPQRAFHRDATVAVLRRSDLAVVGRFTVPDREIYDLVAVDRRLAEAVKGAGLNRPVRGTRWVDRIRRRLMRPETYSLR